jgi:hypothetical protein
MIRLLLTMLAFLATSLAFAQASDGKRRLTYSEPYDFKGVAHLGMTLTEFKVAPVPEEGISLDRGRPSAYCLKPDTAGLVKCTWVQEEFSLNVPIRVPIAGQRTALHSFEFIAKPNDAEPRLFRMTFHHHDDSFNAVTQRYEVFGAALAERFGKPTAVEVRPLQNALGAMFEQEIRMWANKYGKIALIRFDQSLEYITLRYFVPEYVDYHNARSSEEERKKGPKL